MFKMLSVLASAAVLSLFCSHAFAESYSVQIDTSSQFGNNGYIELQLNSGSLNTSPVNASVANFAGATDNPNDPGNSATAGVSGSLSETLLLAANSSVDYVESVTFGDTITFDVTLSGPGVDPTGNAGNSSGTTLVLDVLNSTQSAYLFSSDPDGTSTSASDPLWAVGVINVDPTGTLSMTENPNEGGVVSDLTLTPTGNVPEPSVCLLSGAGLVALALLVRRKYRYA